MCTRLYLNGDGMGKGTHVSLFFVVMRGAYDALLKWPFRQKVFSSLGHYTAKLMLTDLQQCSSVKLDQLFKQFYLLCCHVVHCSVTAASDFVGDWCYNTARNTLGCDQSNVYSLRIFLSTTVKLMSNSFLFILYRSACYHPLQNKWIGWSIAEIMSVWNFQNGHRLPSWIWSTRK